MAQLAELETALINADKAGDADGAKLLAGEIVRVRDSAGNSMPVQENKQHPVMGLVTGLNSTVPNMLGLPVDTATNIQNLARSGYGYLKNKLTGSNDVPDVIDPSSQVGGSAWMANKINQGINTVAPGSDVFSNPRPDSMPAQMLHTSGQVVGGALTNPAGSIREAGRNMASMVPSAIGASSAQQMYPDSPIAPIVGAMAYPMAKSGVQEISQALSKPKNQLLADALQKAQDEGYKVPPSQGRGSMLDKTLEGFAGKASTAQKASLENQGITNKLAARALDLPEDTVLTPAKLQEIRNEAGQVYEKTKQLGTFSTDDVFRKELSNVSKETSALRSEFPDLINKDIAPLVDKIKGKETISSEAAVEAIKQLRSSANDSFRAGNSEVGRAQKGIANSLEGLIERNIQGKDAGQFLSDFRNARQKIAKTYSVEESLNESTGNVSARELARQLEKGKPLSNELRSAAEFAKAFPKAAQNPETIGSQPGLSPLDYMASGVMGGGAALATGNPLALGAAAIPLARPGVRNVILSDWYQNKMAPKAPYGMPAGLAPATAVLSNEQSKAKAKALAAILSSRQ